MTPIHEVFTMWWGIGYGALGIGHWALGMGRRQKASPWEKGKGQSAMAVNPTFSLFPMPNARKI
ncbi:MAG: hypothetical protein RMX96_25115 [Nostoc sp. ChiSLP02]|nr:hypothetical protein [Nostoc sp. DedSLP05]MDZ8099567.1 hypothetical protein [Nostoc sp. DedSLP01]MDZ8188120.1 hypothetical protein [Nostoc sp. ChiSLP02]